LAALAAGPATGWSEEAPGKARVAAEEDADFPDETADEGAYASDLACPSDDQEAAGTVSIRGGDGADADADEPAARVRSHRDKSDETAGRVRISRLEPAASLPRAVRIKDSTRRELPAPRNVMPSKPAQASRVNPAAQRYPFEQAFASPRPAAPPPRAAYGPLAARAWANRPPVSGSPSLGAAPGGVKPVQHQSIQRSPFIEDDELDEYDEEHGPAAMLAGEDDSVALAEGEPGTAASDCPAVTDEEIRQFSGTIDATIERQPIRSMRADMQMRLSAGHSSLMNDQDRAMVREKGRCAAANDRTIVRAYYQQKYGLGYDRSLSVWSDASLAPEFPFCYHPLYFEDANLERCGYSQGCLLQSGISGFQFYANVALLPFKMLCLHPCSYVYPQADCEPCERYGCCDNLWGPRPESLFSSPCFSRRRCW
jgi:hypothetical protein